MRYILTILAIAATISAQADVIVTSGLISTGEVVKVTRDGVEVKAGQNDFTIPLGDILRVEVAKPDSVESSLAAFRAGRNQDALAGFKSLADRYGGLPLPWAEDSLLQLGNVQIVLKDFNGAKQTFEKFKALYPKSPYLAVLKAKDARILFEQNQPAQARQLIESVLDLLLKRDLLTEEQETGVAEGLILLGDCDAAAGKLDDALDDYLKVVTLYDVNDDLTAEAKYKSGKLFEKKGNWRRAKQTYEELLKDSPTLAFSNDIKKRLAAHP